MKLFNPTINDIHLRIGQAFFSLMSHGLYDLFLYHFVTGFFWQCDTQKIKDNYFDNISNNHLEIGVGTAYLLQGILSEEYKPRLALMDLNKNCLTKAAKKLEDFMPETYLQNVLDPINQPIKKFDSIGMNYVLHCVEGSFKTKSIVFKHMKTLLNRGGVLFGATLLNAGVQRSIFSRVFMKLLNWLCIFNNSEDNLEDFEKGLNQHFYQVDIKIMGCAVIFNAREPKLD